jgi:hypothetical protein
VETLHPTAGPVGATGHGGADLDLMRGFLQAVGDRDCALTTARHSLESHLLAFAAEQARVTSTVVDMAEFRKAAG